MKHASPWMEMLTRTNVRMYRRKSDEQDFTFQINNLREKVTAWKGIYRNGVLLGQYFSEGSINVGNDRDILNNLILPQLNVHFHNQLETGMF